MLKVFLAAITLSLTLGSALAQQITPEQLAAQRASMISVLAGQLAVSEMENAKLKEQLAKPPVPEVGPKKPDKK